MESGTFGVIIRVSRVLGVAPYMRTATGGVSKPLYVLSLIAVTSTCSFTAFHLMLAVMDGFNENRKKLIMVDVIRVVVICIMLAITMLGVSNSGTRIAHMVRNLGKLDKIHENIRSNGIVLRDTKTYYLVWIYTVGVVAMRISDYFFKKSSTSAPVYEASVAMVRIWLELVLLQVILFSEKVLATLKIINENLHQMTIKLNVEGESKFMNDTPIKPKLAFVYSKDDIANLEPFHNNTNRGRNIVHAVTSEASESIEYTLRRLSKCYTIVCEIVRDTTDANGLLLIMGLLNHMLHLESTAYQIILWMSYESNICFETIFLIYHAVAHILSLFLLVDTFHRTHAEMERTELLLRRLKYENDPPLAVSNELDLFQRVVILQSSKYSPLDMCTLDRLLLVKVFGMLISYLVIIITYGPRVGSIVNGDVLESFRLTRGFN